VRSRGKALVPNTDLYAEGCRGRARRIKFVSLVKLITLGVNDCRNSRVSGFLIIDQSIREMRP